MGKAEFGCALWLIVGQLAEVVAEAFDAAAVEAGPESGLAYCSASGGDHGFIVVRGAADHVGVWFDVTHRVGGEGTLERGLADFGETGPCSARTFGSCGGEGVGGGVAKSHEDAFCAVGLTVGENLEGGFER